MHIRQKCLFLKNIKFNSDILDCESYALAKAHRLSSNTVRHRSAIPLQRIHSDVMGPIKPLSHTSKRYVITFVDDFSRFIMVFVMANKSDASSYLEQYLDEMRHLLGEDVKVRYLRTDGGMEYAGEMKNILIKEKIALEKAEPDTPTHNGVAERINKSLGEKTTAMLIDSGVPLRYWDHAISQSAYLYNRSPHKANQFLSPYEVFLKQKPDLNYARCFGCLSIYHIGRGDYSRFEGRGWKGILFNNTKTGYRIMDLNSGKIIETEDVQFIENTFYKNLKTETDLREKSIQWSEELSPSNTIKNP